MTELFYYYLTTIVFIGAMAGFYAFYKNVIANKYIESEKRLRLKLNEANSYFRGDSEKVPNFIQGAIGDIGVDGIMKELGIDPGLLKNPLVKGLIDRYAPKILEQMSKKGGSNEQQNNVPFM